MSPEDLKEQYLELIKKSLLNEIYLQNEARIYYLRDCLENGGAFHYDVLHDIAGKRPDIFAEYKRSRAEGSLPFRNIHHAGFQHSMIGRARMNNLHHCLDLIRNDGIPGDVIECGVWRGGAVIFITAYMKTHGLKDRRVFMADSFEGLPPPRRTDEPDLSADKYPQLAISLEDVIKNFQAYDLWDGSVEVLKGWFSDTLPDAPIDQLALLRADGDLYSSTRDILDNLYDKVVPGGVVIIDDFGIVPSCAKAVNDFFEERSEKVPAYEEIDFTGVYWRKP